jgi:hypothetical protein
VKKALPYIILVVVATVILLLVSNSGSRPEERELDERITFRSKDKIPYGMYAAYRNLQHIFPSVPVLRERRKPGDWDSLSVYREHQLLLILSPQFYPDDTEMQELVSFAKRGNTVFISTQSLSRSAQEMLKCEVSDASPSYLGLKENERLSVVLFDPPFNRRDTFSYPGKFRGSWLTHYDTSITQVLGLYENGYPNFLRFRAGTEGAVYLHITPMVFTNYFLLHRNNMNYYDNVLSAIKPQQAQKIVWDEYFLSKKYITYDSFSDNERSGEDDRKSWFGAMMQYPSLKAGFWTVMILLLVYTLIEMRRKQRYIPVVKKPRNDSLDFVKTIGRLYHEKSDHKNLCLKMAAYFLEHIRTQYKLPTNRLDEDFIKMLHLKSGYNEQELRFLVNFISSLRTLPAVSDGQLVHFHRKLEEFYKQG